MMRPGEQNLIVPNSDKKGRFLECLQASKHWFDPTGGGGGGWGGWQVAQVARGSC